MKGRVRALMECVRNALEGRSRQGLLTTIQEAERTGRMVVNADKISFFWNAKKIVESSHHYLAW